MKINLILVALFSFFIFSSCNKSSANIKSIQDKIENDITKGRWIVTKFVDSGIDETSNYLGYLFDFKSSGIVLANKNSDSYTGSWDIEDNNSNDDSLDDLDFNIYFTAPDLPSELNDDWEIISRTTTQIELMDISGGNGQSDYLTFEKN